MTDKIVAGFIPLTDASALLAAADFGFAEAEGLEIELIREVSWANVREKLSTGIFDVAHLLAPMAIASSLDLMPGSASLAAPYVLAMNGNAICAGPKLLAAIEAELGCERTHPLATAKALARIAGRRRHDGLQPLSFGSTFPFSCHSYLLRFWLAAGGLDTAADLRLAVLPPPYMAQALKSGEVDGFCVGEPWSSAAEEQGLGHILHWGCEIIQRLTEKVLAARADWIARNEDIMIRLMRAVSAAAAFTSQPPNSDACCERFAAPDRIGAQPHLIKRALSGSPAETGDGCAAKMILGVDHTGRPDGNQAAWLYSQMLRWNQAGPGLGEAAQAVFSPDLFDRALGQRGNAGETQDTAPAGGLGAFVGPAFDRNRISEYLSAIAQK